MRIAAQSNITDRILQVREIMPAAEGFFKVAIESQFLLRYAESIQN